MRRDFSIVREYSFLACAFVQFAQGLLIVVSYLGHSARPRLGHIQTWSDLTRHTLSTCGPLPSTFHESPKLSGVKASGLESQPSFFLRFTCKNKENKETTSGLEPLTCSLRVSGWLFLGCYTRLQNPYT